MMDVVVQVFAVGIPLITIASAAVAVFMFVKSKGTMDALKEAVSTWQTLAEAYEATNKMLTDKVEQLQMQVSDLKKQNESLKSTLDEVIAAFKRGE